MPLFYLTPRLALLTYPHSLPPQLHHHPCFTVLDLTNTADSLDLFDTVTRLPLREEHPASLSHLLAIADRVRQLLMLEHFGLVLLLMRSPGSRARLVTSCVLRYLGLSIEQATQLFELAIGRASMLMSPLLDFESMLIRKKLQHKLFYLNSVRVLPEEWFVGTFDVYCGTAGQMALVYSHEEPAMDSFLVGLSQQKHHKKHPSFSYLKTAVTIFGDVLIKFYDYSNFKKQFLLQVAFRTSDLPKQSTQIVLGQSSIEPLWLQQKARPKQFGIQVGLSEYCPCRQMCQDCRSLQDPELNSTLQSYPHFQVRQMRKCMYGEGLEGWKSLEGGVETASEEPIDLKYARAVGKCCTTFPSY